VIDHPYESLQRQLATLFAQAERHAAWAAAFQSLLDPTLARHCRFACLRDGAVVFLADTPAWATRLRLHSPRLLEHARGALGLAVDRIQVGVRRNPE
jgi:predicted nucleic acid-binding Zn ribbon protein